MNLENNSSEKSRKSLESAPKASPLSVRERLAKLKEGAKDVGAIIAPLSAEQVQEAAENAKIREDKEKFTKAIEWVNAKSRGEKVKPLDLPLRSFLNKLGISLDVLEQNKERLLGDEKFRDALSLGGALLEEESGKLTRIFESEELGQGGIGKVMKGHLLEKGGTSFTEVVVKKPLVAEDVAEMTKIAYLRELENARLLMKFEDERDQFGGENIVRPVLISKAKQTVEVIQKLPFQPPELVKREILPSICYEIVADEEGKSQDFLSALSTVPPSRLISGFAEIAQGLDWLHERGMIHGDLKMENMMLSKDGKDKLIDFGSLMTEEEVTAQKLQFFDININNKRFPKRVIQEAGSEPREEAIGTTPYYNDVTLLEKCVKEGISISAVDKKALGLIIRETLHHMGFYEIKDFESVDLEKDPYWGLKVSIDPDQDVQGPMRKQFENDPEFKSEFKDYPPKCLQDLYALSRRLMSAAENDVSLVDASFALKKIAAQMQVQVEPFLT